MKYLIRSTYADLPLTIRCCAGCRILKSRHKSQWLLLQSSVSYEVLSVEYLRIICVHVGNVFSQISTGKKIEKEANYTQNTRKKKDMMDIELKCPSLCINQLLLYEKTLQNSVIKPTTMYYFSQFWGLAKLFLCRFCMGSLVRLLSA